MMFESCGIGHQIVHHGIEVFLHFRQILVLRFEFVDGVLNGEASHPFIQHRHLRSCCSLRLAHACHRFVDIHLKFLAQLPHFFSLFISQLFKLFLGNWFSSHHRYQHKPARQPNQRETVVLHRFCELFKHRLLCFFEFGDNLVPFFDVVFMFKRSRDSAL